ncbi:MAG: AMP-binding protein, partial [Rhodospirillales bacterium]|nr:AMP-binding protein [Rhodospirillales bacterium]
MRLIDYFDRGADQYPDRACLVDGNQNWAYAEIRELSNRIAVGLLDTGLGHESRVAVYSPNQAMAYACILGLTRAGCTWVTVNARNAIDENTYILDNTETEWLFYHSSFEGFIDKVRADCPKIKNYVCLDKPGGYGPLLDDWMAPHTGTPPDLPHQPDAVAALVSSGGTTGRPKGVMITHAGLETMNACFNAGMPVSSPPVYLMVAPMTHAAGITSFALLSFGATNVIMSKADPEAIMETIEREKVTHLFLPPTVIYMMLAHPSVRKYDYSSLKNFIYAAAPMSADKLREAISVFGPVMTQTYGQAEAVMICTYFSPEQHVEALAAGNERRLLSCGQPSLFTRLEIMDDDGNLLPHGESGEIVVRGGLVMKGYYKNPDATEEASQFGWHHTGDIGYKDEDDFVYIVDRKKDMIISGGFNVYPSE